MGRGQPACVAHARCPARLRGTGGQRSHDLKGPELAVRQTARVRIRWIWAIQHAYDKLHR
jgi:hypothetical protein